MFIQDVKYSSFENQNFAQPNPFLKGCGPAQFVKFAFPRHFIQLLKQRQYINLVKSTKSKVGTDVKCIALLADPGTLLRLLCVLSYYMGLLHVL